METWRLHLQKLIDFQVLLSHWMLEGDPEMGMPLARRSRSLVRPGDQTCSRGRLSLQGARNTHIYQRTAFRQCTRRLLQLDILEVLYALNPIQSIIQVPAHLR